jgi:signal peptidase I
MQTCQNCGFLNEEGEAQCFKCSAILAESPQARRLDLPLPRGTEPLWWRAYRRIRRIGQLIGRFLVPREPEREVSKRLPLLAAALAFLPGLGQLYNHHYKKAIRLFLLFILLIAVNLMAITRWYSDFLLLLLGLVVVFSTTDAFASAMVINGSIWTAFKSLIFSCFVLFMLGFCFALMQWAIFPGIQLAFVSQDVLAPTFRKGDRVVVDRLTYRLRQPRRGEIVFYKPRKFTLKYVYSDIAGVAEDLYVVHSKNNLERIVGLPGETIELKDRIVYVNAEPSPPQYSPLVTEQLAFGFKIEIPQDSYCIIYSVAPIEDGPIVSKEAEVAMMELRVPRFDKPGVILTDEWAKASIVQKDEIIGLIRCIYYPPERRRWL